MEEREREVEQWREKCCLPIFYKVLLFETSDLHLLLLTVLVMIHNFDDCKA